MKDTATPNEDLQDGSLAGLLYVISGGNQVRLQGGEWIICVTEILLRTETLLKLTWAKVATVPLSPGWRTALCTAGSRSSSNIITLFLPCLYLLLPTLQSSLSQRLPEVLPSSLLSYLSAPLPEVQSRPQN